MSTTVCAEVEATAWELLDEEIDTRIPQACLERDPI